MKHFKTGTAFAALLAVILCITCCLIWVLWVPSPRNVLASLPEPTIEANDIFRSAPDLPEPVLVVLDSGNPNVFSRYITEILRAEGLLSFNTIDIQSPVQDTTLFFRYPLIITASSTHLTHHKGLLADYVHKGGRLLMIDPPGSFDDLLGVKSKNNSLDNRYIRFSRGPDVTRGLTTTPLQIHGQTQLFTPTTCTVLASFCSRDSSADQNVAVGINPFGSGIAAFFAYDLGKSIVYTRQGEPHNGKPSETVDCDGDGVFRTVDLFCKTYDSTLCWIPQGDEQQRLFANILEYLVEGVLVLPRVWYFPNASPSVALITGDAHYASRTAIHRMANYVAYRNGQFSLIDYPTELDSSFASNLHSSGHSIAPHIYYQRPDNRFPMRLRLLLRRFFSPDYFFQPTLSDLKDEIEFATSDFHSRTGLRPTFTRMHFLTWCGWSETAQILSRYGYRMDFSITGAYSHQDFHLPGSGSMKSPVGFGYINGSGLPMRFMNQDGTLADMFSQLTEVEDDVISGACIRNPPNDTATNSAILSIIRTLINESVELYNSALVFNFHPEHAESRFPDDAPLTWPWVSSTIDYLAHRKVPMISADSWLRFSEARYSIHIDHISYDVRAKSGRFTVSSILPVGEITFLLRNPEGVRTYRVQASLTGETQNSYALQCNELTFNDAHYTAVTVNLEPATPVVFQYRL